MQPLRALSIRQPWAHAIIRMGKDLENRSAAYSHRGPLLIHASGSMTQDEYTEAWQFMADRGIALGGMHKRSELPLGGIVGMVEVTGCVQESDSPWWMGPNALVLANARPLPFVACPGTIAPMFWTPSDEVIEQLRPHL